DFADVKSVMRDAGKAMMGTGEAEGDGRALAAAQKAIANPLLDGVSMAGAKGVIISITGGEDMGLLELEEAGNHIRELVDPDANIIWGSAFNEDLAGKIRVSVVATGLEPAAAGAGAAPQPAARPFSFQARPAPTTPAPVIAPEPVVAAPVAPAMEMPAEDPVPAPGFSVYDENDDEPLTLDAPVEAAPDAAVDDDELVLGTAGEEPVAAVIVDDAVAPPEPALAEAESAEQTPRVAPGATLFERMSRLSRGSDAPAEGDADGDKDDAAFPTIPRFLGRQSNQ
ncbi:MAG: cell division protein FtsZ, partial [Sphingomonas sp.]